MLLAGVARFGVGNWKKILSEYKFHHKRTAVDLKDKYRNILRAQERQTKAARSAAPIQYPITAQSAPSTHSSHSGASYSSQGVLVHHPPRHYIDPRSHPPPYPHPGGVPAPAEPPISPHVYHGRSHHDRRLRGRELQFNPLPPPSTSIMSSSRGLQGARSETRQSTPSSMHVATLLTPFDTSF